MSWQRSTDMKSAMDELNRMNKADENKSVHCDGHATLFNA